MGGILSQFTAQAMKKARGLIVSSRGLSIALRYEEYQSSKLEISFGYLTSYAAWRLAGNLAT